MNNTDPEIELHRNFLELRATIPHEPELLGQLLPSRFLRVRKRWTNAMVNVFGLVCPIFGRRNLPFPFRSLLRHNILAGDTAFHAV